MTRLIAIALLVLCTMPTTNLAHSLGLSLLRLDQTEQLRYTVTWQPSPALTQLGQEHSLSFPDGCHFGDAVLSCSQGINGIIAVDNLPPHADVVMHLTVLSGQEQYRLMQDGHVNIDLTNAQTTPTETFTDYFVIGVEHILLGIDHLLFVVGLVLLVGFTRGLIWAVTAFTLSHSLTLVLSMLDLIGVPIGPVEVVIALSIVLVIREAMSRRETLTRRWPWLVAFGFGLIHGLGFASALGSIGLPSQQEFTALLAFNLGVEGGQLAALGLFWMAARGFRLVPNAPERAAWLSACYLAGTAATFWTLERAWSLFA